MLTVTIRQLRQADRAVMELASREWPAALSIKIARLLKAVREEMGVFQPQWHALAAKHGKPAKDNPNMYSFETPEAQAAFDEESKPLLETTIELNCGTVALPEFGGAPLKPTTMLDLEWFIVVPEEAKP